MSASTVLHKDMEAQGLELVETHISWVFLGQDEVWKVKKPVELGFLDFSTIEKRRQACEAEVRLNRRLSPEVYLGVVPVGLDADGSWRFGASSPTLDWAVHMKRLPDRRRADRLLADGGLTTADVERLADRIADFHFQARCDQHTERYGSLESIAANVDENFEQTKATISRYLSREEALEIESWQTSHRRFV